MMLSGFSSVGDLVTRFLFLPSWCVTKERGGDYSVLVQLLPTQLGRCLHPSDTKYGALDAKLELS